MIKGLIRITILLAFSSSAFASWEILDMPTDRGFGAIWAQDEQTIFVVGHQGLWKTFDGINWVLDSTPAYPTQIYFVDDTLGFLRGWILTTDGGRTWQIGDTVVGGGGPLSFPEGQSLIGYGCGYDDTMRKTEDGGWHWTKLPPLPEVYPASEEYVYPRDICFPSNPDTGYLTVSCEEWISEDNVIPRNSYFKTTDGGQTWVLNEEGLYNDDFNPYLVDFPQNSSIGYMASPTKLFKTQDGGTTWDTVISDLSSAARHHMCFPENHLTGYVLDVNRIHRTLDGGNTWQTFGLGQDTVFACCHFLNNWVGFISGTGTTAAGFLYTPGFVFKTTDGLLGIAEEDWIDVEPTLLEISTPAVFSRELVLRYQVREPGRLTVSVFDASGRRTESLGRHDVGCGNGALSFNGNRLPQGVYFIQVGFSSAQGNQSQILRTVKVR